MFNMLIGAAFGSLAASACFDSPAFGRVYRGIIACMILAAFITERLK
jgi:hypothetical protein